jgi:hypothetical protein
VPRALGDELKKVILCSLRCLIGDLGQCARPSSSAYSPILFSTSYSCVRVRPFVHHFRSFAFSTSALAGLTLPVSAGTGLSQHVDELRNHGSGYAVRLPGGPHRHPRALLGSQIAENHILGGDFLQRLAHHWVKFNSSAAATKYSRWRNFMGGLDCNLTHFCSSLGSSRPRKKDHYLYHASPIRRMQRSLLEMILEGGNLFLV